MVVIFFWQGLLSYETVIDIYQYIGSKPKVVFMCADYSPMTGGCHFFGSCEEYSSECGRCPMINSKNKSDFTHWNNIFRQKVIKEIKPVILVNTYMRRFFERSSVVAAGATLKSFSLTMDLEQFRPISSSRILDKYNLKKDDKFIIFFGCQNLDDARKGMDYLVESLNKFYSKITNEEAANVLILSIGKNSNYISEKIKFQRKHLGYVPFEDLPLLYSFADIFLSASVNDAGPSMVNQSIACGTPVVAFEIGSALDVIKDKGTGYTVPLKNTEAFADAIWKIYKLSSLERKNLSIRCRTVAVQHQSYEALVSTIDECFS